VDQTVTISGRVIIPDGVTVDLSRFAVQAYAQGVQAGSSPVAADGSYLITAAKGGSFRVKFAVPSDAPVLGEWWEGKEDETEATPIVIADGGSATGIDATLRRSGSISGKITLPAGIRGEVTVRAFLGSGQPRGNARSTGNGGFIITGLAEGSYSLQFFSNQLPVVEQWWSGKPDYASADRIALGAGEVATCYDVTMVAAATISGRFRLPAGVRPGENNPSVQLYREDGSWYPISALVDGDGTYRIPNVAPGTYRVSFGSGSLPILPEWWDDKPDFASATPITVVAGEKRTGVNVTYAKAPSIHGKVTLPAGVSLSDGTVQVRLTRASDGGGVAATTVLPDGTYSFGSLRPIAYRVAFVAQRLPVLDEWWEDAPDEASSTPVTLAVGEDRALDATLAPAASISGRVWIPSGLGSTAAGVTVTAYSAANTVARTTATAADGTYTVTGLPAGAYRLRFSSDTLPVAAEWWNNAADYASAAPIAVRVLQVRSGFNAYLDRPSSISGRVTLPPGVVAGAGQIHVDAYSPAREVVGTAAVRADGTYAIRGLMPGTYRLLFRADDLPVAYEWWQDRPSFASASDLVLGVREAREGVDAVLERAASLSGTVTLPPGASFDQGRVEAAVFAAEDATTPMGTAAVRPDGTYLVEGLRGASVKVRFTACGMPAAGEWWNNKADFATALTQTTVNGSEKKNVNVILATSSTAPPC